MNHQNLRVMAGTAAVLAMAGCVTATGTATATPTATLENTYWKLLRAHGQSITVDDGQREPHLLLHGAGRGLGGFSGCNRLGGSYTRGGAAVIHFDAALLARSACEGLAAQHQAVFLQALSRAAGWRIAGQGLELLDREGAVVASFESVYLR